MAFRYCALCLYECVLRAYLSDKLCTLCDEATFPGCTSRSLLLHSSLNPLFVTARQAELHRSPAQMPWLSFHVCSQESVCVRAHRLLAPQQDCQSVCDFTHTLRLSCFPAVPLLPFCSFFILFLLVL